MAQIVRVWPAAAALAAVLLAAGAAPAQISPADQAAAKTAVEQTYGKEIQQAKAKGDPAGLVQVARALLQAADDESLTPAIRAEMAHQAMGLAAPLGTQEGILAAEQGLTRWSYLSGASGVDRGKALVDLYTSQLRLAKGDRLKEVNIALARAAADLGSSYEAAGDADNAVAQLTRAASLAQTAGLADLAELCNQSSTRLTRERQLKQDLAEAQQELTAAVAGNNAPLVKSINERVAMMYLNRKGDVAAAAPYLAAASHAWAAGAQNVARRAAGAKLNPDQAVAAADMLKKASDQAETSAKVTLLESVLEIATETQANIDSGSPQAAKLELLRQQARSTLEKLPGADLLGVRKRLGPLNGALVVNPDGSVTLSYNFVKPEQMNDWSLPNGRWVCNGDMWSQSKNRGGDTLHNVRFAADKPLRVSFTMSFSGTGLGFLCVNDSPDQADSPHLTLGYYGGRGWEMGGLGTKPASLDETLPGPPYRVSLAYDGTSSFTWTVNGKVLGTVKAAKPLTGASLRVGVAFRKPAPGHLSDVIIHGTPVLTMPGAAAGTTVKPPTGGQPPAGGTPPPPPPPPPPGPRRGPFPRPGG